MIVTAVAALASGCGHVERLADGGGRGDGGAGVADAAGSSIDAGAACNGKTIAFSDIETCYVRAVCGVLVRCQGLFDSVDQCVQNAAGELGLEIDNQVQQFAAAITAGKIDYDGKAAATCLAAVAAETCTSSLGEEPACTGVFTGSSTDGDPCFFGTECGTGGECQGAGADNTCTAGMCVLPAGIGEPCDSRPCEPGAHCVVDPSGNHICESGETSSPCGTDSDCDPAYWCQSGQCKPDQPAGAACSADSQCAGPNLCVNGTCGPVDQTGDACAGACFGRLYCSIPSSGDAGPAVGTCKPLPGLNESCADAGRCAGFDLFCDATKTCAKRPTLDHPCRPGDCAAGLFCTAAITGAAQGSCSKPLPNGQACTTPSQCQSHECVGNGSSSSGSCEALDICYQ